MLLLNTEQRVWILRTMWYFSVSFLINLQKCQQFCVFLSIWGDVCTLMRKKMNLNDFSKWLQYDKFKGVWILSVPTVYIQYIYYFLLFYIFFAMVNFEILGYLAYFFQHAVSSGKKTSKIPKTIPRDSKMPFVIYCLFF